MSIAVTADHGMNAKSHAVDLGKVLARADIPAEAIPIIKDRYVEHHQNMGGAAYIYLENELHITEAIATLEDSPGVEQVMTAEESAKRYHLHPSRIGDLLVLADNTSVFGTLDTHQAPIELRSHGSLHERTVPLILYGNRPQADSMLENKDAVSVMMTSFEGTFTWVEWFTVHGSRLKCPKWLLIRRKYVDRYKCYVSPNGLKKLLCVKPQAASIKKRL